MRLLRSIYLAESPIDRFLRLKCAGDLIERGVFANGDDLQRAVEVAAAVFEELQEFESRDPGITAIVVAPTTRPSLAALLAFTTKWDVMASSPLFKKTDYDIQRLTLGTKPGNVATYAVTQRRVLLISDQCDDLSAVHISPQYIDELVIAAAEDGFNPQECDVELPVQFEWRFVSLPYEGSDW